MSPVVAYQLYEIAGDQCQQQECGADIYADDDQVTLAEALQAGCGLREQQQGRDAQQYRRCSNDQAGGTDYSSSGH